MNDLVAKARCGRLAALEWRAQRSGQTSQPMPGAEILRPLAFQSRRVAWAIL